MAIDRAKMVFEQELLPALSEMYKNGQIEFRLSMQSSNHFIIHPMNADGVTIDIDWSGENASYSHDFEDDEIDQSKIVEDAARILKNGLP